MNGDWCEKYYQEGTDDLGKWRIPNEKELYFIPMYCGEEITGNLAGYKPSGAQTETGTMRYAAKTKYNRNLIHDPSNPGNTFMIYHLQKDGSSGTPIVTTVTISPVRTLQSDASVTRLRVPDPTTPPTVAEERDSDCRGLPKDLTYG